MTNEQRIHALTELYVARPGLPSIAEYTELLETIWDRRVLTNRGPLVVEFEHQLAEFLGVEHISVVTNATIGLMVALMHVGVKEVITTPFTFVATANAIRLVGARPVFADIDPVSFALDPAAVERKISSQTSAIMPVHCYGLPCDMDAFAQLGARYNIPVIYDAAHAFDVRQKGKSILQAGTMSVVSFHATKVFHSVEGGAIISPDAETKVAIDRLCNNGLTNETTVDAIGLNGKMSEFHAAMGLIQLRHVKAEIAARRVVAKTYAQALRSVRGIRLICPENDLDHNYYSYPILIEPDFPMTRDQLCTHLRTFGVVARRYFYPLIPHLAAFQDPSHPEPERFAVAEEAAARVMCLPMYGDLNQNEQSRVIEGITSVSR